MIDRDNKKYVVFTIGQNEITVVSDNNKQYIVAKGTLTHVIDEPVLVQRLLAKYGH